MLRGAAGETGHGWIVVRQYSFVHNWWKSKGGAKGESSTYALSWIVALAAGAKAVFAGTTRHVSVMHVEDIGVGPTDIGIRYEVPSVAPVITEEQAIQAAKNRKPGLADQAASIETRYVLFSDDGHFDKDATGRQYRPWQKVPAWVVTFKGVILSSRGGDPDAVNHEVNIVIDARTGEYMQLFSYR
jgi:hypothetical protein